jgi:hypothetical protein
VKPHPNGAEVIRIGRRGMRKFALGDGEPVELDVVATHVRWVDVDRQYRDGDGKVIPEKVLELNAIAVDFVAALFGLPPEQIDLACALEFLARLTEVSEELQDFFVVKSRGKPSSPGSTELTFSE